MKNTDLALPDKISVWGPVVIVWKYQPRFDKTNSKLQVFRNKIISINIFVVVGHQLDQGYLLV